MNKAIKELAIVENTAPLITGVSGHYKILSYQGFW